MVSVPNEPNSGAPKPARSTPLAAGATQESHKDEIHFVLQGKGGVGKSFVATLLAEFLRTKVPALRCFDTDPVNPTFSRYSEFSPQRVPLFEKGQINVRAFDGMLGEVAEAGVSAVIDNGATTFIPLMNYVHRSRAFEALAEMKKSVVVHTIVAGGGALSETVDSFTQIMTALPLETRAIVWINAFYGPVSRNGVEFEDFPAYQRFQDRVGGIITLPEADGDLVTRDLQDLRTKGLSFQAAVNGADFFVMERSRLLKVWKDMSAQMESVL